MRTLRRGCGQNEARQHTSNTTHPHQLASQEIAKPDKLDIYQRETVYKGPFLAGLQLLLAHVLRTAFELLHEPKQCTTSNAVDR